MFIGISLRTDSIRQQNEEIFNRSLLSHLWIFLYQKTIFFMLYRQRSTFFYETRIKPAEKTISPFRKRTSEPGRTQKTKYAAVSRIPSEVAVGRRVQGSVKRNVFVKPNEQSRACASYVMARKRLLKTNVFVKPNSRAALARAMPWRENDCWKRTVSLSRAQSRTKFELCRDEKWTKEIQGFFRSQSSAYRLPIRAALRPTASFIHR